MKGYVDDSKRALIEIKVRSQSIAASDKVTAWIDTAFNGHLVFSRELIDTLHLQQEAATEAILADGSLVTLESFICFVEWGSKVVAAQVIANDGSTPLLGTELLSDCVLVVDYKTRAIIVTT
ncbi:hypothetical protein SH449x_002184 [Pirellulaceae bacterium SH449]